MTVKVYRTCDRVLNLEQKTERMRVVTQMISCHVQNGVNLKATDLKFVSRKVDVLSDDSWRLYLFRDAIRNSAWFLTVKRVWSWCTLFVLYCWLQRRIDAVSVHHSVYLNWIILTSVVICCCWKSSEKFGWRRSDILLDIQVRALRWIYVSVAVGCGMWQMLSSEESREERGHCIRSTRHSNSTPLCMTRGVTRSHMRPCFQENYFSFSSVAYPQCPWAVVRVIFLRF